MAVNALSLDCAVPDARALAHESIECAPTHHTLRQLITACLKQLGPLSGAPLHLSHAEPNPETELAKTCDELGSDPVASIHPASILQLDPANSFVGTWGTFPFVTLADISTQPADVPLVK